MLKIITRQTFMLLSILSLVAMLLAMPLNCLVARADVGDEVLRGGVWHFKSIPCVDTTITEVGPRLMTAGQKTFTAKDFESGAYVEFNTGLGIASVFPGTHASVTQYGTMEGVRTMAREKRGDRVQVCFLGGPLPLYDDHGQLICNPDKDNRGREYRVYDYRQRAVYYGGNSEHGCGGA